MPLTPTDRDMLVFARKVWIYAGNREAAIRDRFDMSETTYNLKLARLARRPDADAELPTDVRRLRRIIAGKQRSRQVESSTRTG